MKSAEQRWVENWMVTGPLLEEQRKKELEPLLELKGAPEAATRLREILRQAQ